MGPLYSIYPSSKLKWALYIVFIPVQIKMHYSINGEN